MSYQLLNEECGMVVNKMANATYSYAARYGIHYLVTGMSGGKDSTVVGGVNQVACKMAANTGYHLVNVGVTMPCDSKPEAEELAMEAIELYGMEHLRVDLTDTFKFMHKGMTPLDWNRYFRLSHGTEDARALARIVANHNPPGVLWQLDMKILDLLRKHDDMPDAKSLEWARKVAQGNIKARLRMITNYHIARMLGGMVMSTDNLSEYWMGFWTICGDVGDFGQIQNILKGSELMQIARYLNAPQGILEAIPDDGNDVGEGSDEGQLGADYPTIDRVMIDLIKNGFDPNGSEDQMSMLAKVHGVPVETVKSLALRCLRGAYKRRGTLVLTREYLDLPPVEEIEFGIAA